MGLKEVVKRSTLANLVAGIAILTGLAYFIWTKNTNGVMYITSTALGWLLKEIKK